MKQRLIYLCIILFINSYLIQSQTTYPVDKWVEYIEALAEDGEDEAKIETIYTDLSYRSEHPFELNQATQEQLETLPFLSDKQIQNLLSHRLKYGAMQTLYELKNVEGMDYGTIEYLLPFVYIGRIPVDKRPISVKNLLKKGKNELQIRYDRCFQQKSGYKTYPDTVLTRYPNRRYLGEPFYHALYYAYTFDDRIQAGMVAEKDAGEPFWNSRHKGYDFYSGHVLIKNFGLLKTLVVGDYKVSFGQGLAISHDFLPGAGASPTGIERRKNGFRRHYSTNETDFFRGGAATFQWRKWELSLFGSYRRLDGAVENRIFTSFKTDGLHRLERDWEKRRQIPVQTYGGALYYATSRLSLGMTLLSYSFRPNRWEPEEAPYRVYYFRGDRNGNASFSYQWKNRSFSFYGETALSFNGAVATLDALRLTPRSYLSFLLSYRYYDRRYHAFYGNAFGQTTSVQNEQGLYLGVELAPAPYWKLAGYADFFRFPWLKYGVDAPSTGQEYSLQARFAPSSRFSVSLRYKYKKKEENAAEATETALPLVFPFSQQRLRLRQEGYPVPSLKLATSAEGIRYRKTTGAASKGILLTQGAGWKPLSSPFQADLSVSWFCTDDYVSRLTAYEKQLLYAFNQPSFYGKGLRFALSCRWSWKDKLIFSAKAAHTCYLDRQQIGTAQELIDGRQKTDLSLLVRWKFTSR